MACASMFNTEHGHAAPCDAQCRNAEADRGLSASAISVVKGRPVDRQGSDMKRAPYLSRSPMTPRAPQPLTSAPVANGQAQPTMSLFTKFATAGSPRLSDTLNRACHHIETAYLERQRSPLGLQSRGQVCTKDGDSPDDMLLSSAIEVPASGVSFLENDVSAHKSLKQALRDTLRTHTRNPSMQEAVCNMLSLLLDDQPEITSEEDEPSGLIQQLQAALRDHPDNPGLAKWACSAAAKACAGSNDNANLARQQGLLIDIRKVLARFSSHPLVVEQACEVICEMCDASFANRAAAGHAGLLTEIQVVLKRNRGDAKVKACTANAVASICAGHKNNTWLALRMGLWESVGGLDSPSKIQLSPD